MSSPLAHRCDLSVTREQEGSNKEGKGRQEMRRWDTYIFILCLLLLLGREYILYSDIITIASHRIARYAMLLR